MESKHSYEPIPDEPIAVPVSSNQPQPGLSEKEVLLLNSVIIDPEAEKRKSSSAPAYDDAVHLPNAQPQQYQTYQNSGPPTYENLPVYADNPVPQNPNTGVGMNLNLSKFRDSGFTLFFMAWFLAANFLLFRVIFVVNLSVWWEVAGTPIWATATGTFCGLIWSWLWIIVINQKIFSIPRIERVISIIVFTNSAIAASYVALYGDISHWIFILWLGCIVRILWDACVSTPEDEYLTASIIQLLKPYLLQTLGPIVVLCIGTTFWLWFWSFSFSVSTATFVITRGGVSYPESFFATSAFLLIVMVWTLMVIRSMIQIIVASVIVHWYNNKGEVSVNHYVMQAFTGTFVQSFGTAVFASIFVDIFGAATWLLTRLHSLFYGKKSKNSVLMEITHKIEQVVNSSSYCFIVSQNMEFVDASHAAYPFLTAAGSAIRCTTMKYHGLFISCQSFAITLGATGSVVSAVLAGVFTWAITSIYHAACVSLITCYARDPAFLTHVDNALATQIQIKLGESQKDEV